MSKLTVASVWAGKSLPVCHAHGSLGSVQNSLTQGRNFPFLLLV
ncbi:hypothetical protein VB834_22785 [Limnoraphis robusta Tam1]|uniref:Uncharacterized protein n=1 Tax=Limnoraphis robusta CCNP1315 TaxID=3110306 RepID=A0ABU5TXH1_9CYAN|nr:hypothetical protein [Limnoraphis robusta]MEA5498085.1 hypothetical protein [Limnoraphis robusta BA-68 BA1]MEA5519639.1 hypothetical protein [Limnoraphis robusta CCNP1315]MEA5541862.1 hypothetical protein [Limnoraphis robusta Tam1]MEA5549347.1 hypothetical protein [Limnoraphis robusta CCNP1324]